MKKDFDFLFTDKIPFQYFEKTCLLVSEGNLVAVSQDQGMQTIPIANLAMIYLGHGCSITRDGAVLCAKYDCYIAFVRGGLNVHAIWHCGRWGDPQRLSKQVLAFSNPDNKLNIAKELVKLRLHNEKASKDELDKIDQSNSHEQLLGYEASWARKIYKQLASERETGFKRNKNSREGINSIITLLNNVLYTFFTSLVLAYGLNPSIGFVHGSSRRGGLAFDLADIYKFELSLRPAFSYEEPVNIRICMYDLAKKLKANRCKIPKQIMQIMETHILNY